ncbi:MAG: hypothetical protein A2503_10195 [Burkholderiales bacterium RIFOXYD12_FULL_59_19]|nr:MAG: hypothetical protein A2503_10195 [Burkholderiales bacterium RIFOXYD12_FULL_59_19]
MEYVNTPGPNRPLAPQAVVLLDPTTGLPMTTMPVTLSGESITVTVPAAVEINNDDGNPIPVTGPVTDAQLRAVAVPVSGPVTDAQLRATPIKTAVCLDSIGAAINPDAWAHTYGYDASGNLTTDTGADGASTWIKTYAYTAGILTSQTKWVKQ